jgi:hypothetical protein
MKREQIKKIKVGDFVTVALEVIELDKFDDEMPVKVKELGWLDEDQIESHTPRGVKAGDKVKFTSPENGNGSEFTVVSVNGEFAWIVISEHPPGVIFPLSELERA